MRLLLVEDNTELAGLTAEGLANAGFGVDAVGSLADALAALESSRFATVILDLGLPDGDGGELVRTMRAQQDSTPVLMLTARGSIQDRVEGLAVGADDYLVKPFALEELVARIRALLRRPSQFLGKPLTAGNIALDPVGRQLFVEERAQELSAREIALLEILLRRVGRVVPKRLVEDHLFGHAEEVQSNAVEVYVHRLRKQLTDSGAKVEIRTIRGLGYLLTETTA